MGSKSSKPTYDLFCSVFRGEPLDAIYKKIVELRNELPEDEAKKFKLSDLRDTMHETFAGKNLLMISCMGAGEESTMANRVAFIKKYITEFDVNALTEKKNESCLYFACRAMLTYEPSLDKMVNGHGERVEPLHADAAAAARLRGDIIELLLSEGADATMNVPVATGDHPKKGDIDHNNFTPLHAAAAAGFGAGVVELIGRGANATLLTADKKTVLHLAARSGNAKSVTSIIAVLPRELRSAEDASGRSALSYAIESSSEAAVISLIVNGADFGTKYDSLCGIAQSGAVRALFPDRANNCQTQLFGRYASASPEFMREFFNATGIEHAMDSEGCLSVVNMATRAGQAPTLSATLAAYPLVQACVLSNAKLFGLLVKQGYDPLQPCPLLPRSITPLHIVFGMEGTSTAATVRSTFSRFVEVLTMNNKTFSLEQLTAVLDGEKNRPHVYAMSREDIADRKFSCSDSAKLPYLIKVVGEQTSKDPVAQHDKLDVRGFFIDSDANNGRAFELITGDPKVGPFLTYFGTEDNSFLKHSILEEGIAKMAKLEKLSLVGLHAECSGAARVLADHLAPSCTYLNLSGCTELDPAITLAQIAKLTQLKVLLLADNAPSEIMGKVNAAQCVVNDSSIAQLGELIELEELDLSGTGKSLTAKGLTNLARLMKAKRDGPMQKVNLERCSGISNAKDQQAVGEAFAGIVDDLKTALQTSLFD
jgi:hypothetical protein